MSDQMRDARLKRALDSAPDAAGRPADAVRESILHKARLTAAAAKPAMAAPRSRPFLFRPWSSALATLGVAALVGVMVWQQDWLEHPPEAEAPPLAQAPEKLPEPQVQAQQAPADKPAPAAVAQPGAKEIAPPRPAVLPLAPPLSRQQRADAMQARRERMAEAKVPAPALPPPPPVMMPPVAAMPAPMPAPAAPVAETRLADQAAARNEALSQRFSLSGAIAAPVWSQLRMDKIVLRRAVLPTATQFLINQILRGKADEGESIDPTADLHIDLRIELSRVEQVVGLLELGPTAVRWTPAGQPPRVTKPAQLAELRAQLQAALGVPRAASASSE